MAFHGKEAVMLSRNKVLLYSNAADGHNNRKF